MKIVQLLGVETFFPFKFVAKYGFNLHESDLKKRRKCLIFNKTTATTTITTVNIAKNKIGLQLQLVSDKPKNRRLSETQGTKNEKSPANNALCTILNVVSV